MRRSGQLRPVRLLEVELSEPLPAVTGGSTSSGAPYGAAHVLVRLHGLPLGVVDVDVSQGDVAAATLADRVWQVLSEPLVRHLAQDGAAGCDRLPVTGVAAGCRRTSVPDEGAPLISVVVPTASRPAMLRRCLESLLACDYPSFEVVVVDNAPDDRSTRAVVDGITSAALRYVAEPARGASRARNRGLAVARGDIVAFTDDDVVVDPRWLRELAAEFVADPQVSCVTGLVLPAGLDTPAQLAFEGVMGFGLGFSRRVFSRDMVERPSALFPYTPGCGATNNAAVRADVARRLGGLDVRLGAGARVPGEDLEFMTRLLLDGGRIVYQPAALVHHRHRTESAELRQQLFAYGAGATAVLARWSGRREFWRLVATSYAEVVRKALHPPQTAQRIGAVAARPPASLLLGYCAGPLIWLDVTLRTRRGWTPRAAAGGDPPRLGNWPDDA